MSTGPVFRESLLAARQRLVDQRRKIREQHEAGSPGIQICACLTDLVDSVVLDLYEAALADLYPRGCETLRSRIALVPLGGYGRRDIAPYSDVDLMILHVPGAEDDAAPLAKRLMRDLFDVGLELGQSVRTTAEACELASADATICTSLFEARYLAGSVKLFSSFEQKFQRHTQRHFPAFFAAIEQSRRDERAQFGETVYLLEPNVKRSRGGLRDIQLLRWVGFARYCVADPEGLQLLGALSKVDRRTIRRAAEFLLHLRNELHFHAGKAQDVLGRTEQLRLAHKYAYQGTEAILPVEQFMGEYFRHTEAVRSVAAEFVAKVRPGSRMVRWLGSVLSHQVEGDYLVGPREIRTTNRGLVKVRSDLNEVLRLMDIANLYDKRIAQPTWDAIRAAVPGMTAEATGETTRRFLSILSQPARLSEVLHRLHELGVLEKIIPAFAHARCLLQFNEYHKYTVDEHCLLAVQRATDLMSDPGPIGRIYRGIKQKRTLHLALLIHDLGKGFVEDHSEVGLRIADETARLLHLPSREADSLKFLVHKHLMMAHMAFRRDTSDNQLMVRFAVEIGSPEMLDMLLVLTVSDISAVGPGVWNEWKSSVLVDLYHRLMRHLAGDSAVSDSTERVEQRRSAVRASLAHEPAADLAWYDRQIDSLPSAYLDNSKPEQIADELKGLRTLEPGQVHAMGRYLADRRTVEYVVGTSESIAPGVFHRLTGALASQGLQILSAEINTLVDGLVLDRFYVVDPDYSDQPPADRIASVSRALAQSLKSPTEEAPVFRKVWRSESEQAQAALVQLPTRVRSDNSTSNRFTILDIFARDRRGLLYTISRTLFQERLSVSLAKIGTYLDQVVDVFYVTDEFGGKIEDEARLQALSGKLIEAIEALRD
jgi:[protein-PII] uridylyltransferase